MREDYSDPKWMGQKFNNWTVIGLVKGVSKDKRQKPANLWLCRCDCGVEKVVRPIYVRTGKSKSCGCLQPIAASESNKIHKVVHGGAHDRLYHVWTGIRNRCLNQNADDYFRYGGRGITLCEEWNDYAKFRDWSYANGYQGNLTIDRIDVNGNYEPSNCRWVNAKTQARNRTNNVRRMFNGEMKCLSEIAEETGIPYRSLYSSIVRSGRNADVAVSELLKQSN